MQVLALLPAETLGRLACVNRAFYCFGNHEDLWRALTLEVSLRNLPGISNTDMHCYSASRCGHLVSWEQYSS